MQRRVWLLGLLMISALWLPMKAIAHQGGVQRYPYHQEVKAGPYTLQLEVEEWPMRATKWTDMVVTVAGEYRASEITVALTYYPAGSTNRRRTALLTSHNDFPGAAVWGGRYFPIPEPGMWVWEFEVTGPLGKGVGRLEPFQVLEPPGVPMWAGWVIACTPLYGLLWFAFREYRRIGLLIRRGASAPDERA